MVTTLRCMVIAVVMLGLPGIALADDAGVIASGGSPEVVGADWDAAVTATTEELRRAGYDIALEHTLTYGQSPAECVESACLNSQRASMGVSLLALVIVWGGTEVHDRAAHVVVSLVTADAHFDATVEVANGDVAVAARRAVLEARESMARGHRPGLIVQGTPIGAMILVDGVETAALPWEGAVAPGHHRVEVRHRGYVTQAQEVDVHDDPARIDAALVPEAAASGAPDVAWLVIGGVSLAASIAPIANAIVSGTTDSCASGCTGGSPHDRSLTVPDDGAVAGWTIGGAAAAAFGVVAIVIGVVSGGSTTRSPAALRPDGLVISF